MMGLVPTGRLAPPAVGARRGGPTTWPGRAVVAAAIWFVILPAGLAAAAGSSVSILDGHFSPATVTVPVGGSVTWANDGSTDHTVTPLDGGFSQSGSIGGGESFSATFATSGTFRYECSIHGFRGVVIVAAAPTPMPTPRPTPHSTPKPTPHPTPAATPRATARATSASTSGPTPSSTPQQTPRPTVQGGDPLPAGPIGMPSSAPSGGGSMPAASAGGASVAHAARSSTSPPSAGLTTVGSSVPALIAIFGLLIGFTVVLVMGSQRRTIADKRAPRRP